MAPKRKKKAFNELQSTPNQNAPANDVQGSREEESSANIPDYALGKNECKMIKNGEKMLPKELLNSDDEDNGSNEDSSDDPDYALGEIEFVTTKSSRKRKKKIKRKKTTNNDNSKGKSKTDKMLPNELVESDNENSLDTSSLKNSEIVEPMEDIYEFASSFENKRYQTRGGIRTAISKITESKAVSKKTLNGNKKAVSNIEDDTKSITTSTRKRKSQDAIVDVEDIDSGVSKLTPNEVIHVTPSNTSKMPKLDSMRKTTSTSTKNIHNPKRTVQFDRNKDISDFQETKWTEANIDTSEDQRTITKRKSGPQPLKVEDISKLPEILYYEEVGRSIYAEGYIFNLSQKYVFVNKYFCNKCLRVYYNRNYGNEYAHPGGIYYIPSTKTFHGDPAKPENKEHICDAFEKRTDVKHPIKNPSINEIKTLPVINDYETDNRNKIPLLTIEGFSFKRVWNGKNVITYSCANCFKHHNNLMLQKRQCEMPGHLYYVKETQKLHGEYMYPSGKEHFCDQYKYAHEPPKAVYTDFPEIVNYKKIGNFITIEGFIFSIASNCMKNDVRALWCNKCQLLYKYGFKEGNEQIKPPGRIWLHTETGKYYGDPINPSNRAHVCNGPDDAYVRKIENKCLSDEVENEKKSSYNDHDENLFKQENDRVFSKAEFLEELKNPNTIYQDLQKLLRNIREKYPHSKNQSHELYIIFTRRHGTIKQMIESIIWIGEAASLTERLRSHTNGNTPITNAYGNAEVWMVPLLMEEKNIGKCKELEALLLNYVALNELIIKPSDLQNVHLERIKDDELYVWTFNDVEFTSDHISLRNGLLQMIHCAMRMEENFISSKNIERDEKIKLWRLNVQRNKYSGKLSSLGGSYKKKISK